MLARWSLSYIVISVIAIAIISYSSTLYSKEIKRELDRINLMQLRNTQKEIDERVAALRRFCEVLNVDGGAIEKLMKGADFDSISRYEMYEASKKIRISNLYDSYAYTYLVYYPDQDLIVSADHYARSKYYYEAMLSGLGFSYSEFKTLLSITAKNTVMYQLTHNEREQLVAFSRPLNSSKELSDKAIAIMIFDFSAALGDRDERDSILLYNGNSGMTITNGDINKESAEKIIKGLEVKSEIALKDSIVSMVHSQYENWYFIAITKSGEALEVVSRLNDVVIGFAAVYMLVSILLIIQNSKKAYKPLKTTIEALSEDGSVDDKSLAMMDFMSTSINTLKDKNKTLGTVVKDQSQIIASSVKRRLLSEEGGYNNIGSEVLARYGIPTSGPSSVIAFSRDDNDFSNEISDILKSYNLSFAYSEEKRAFLLWSDSEKELSDKASSAASEIRKRVESAHIALSRVYEAPAGFYKEYKEAKFLLGCQRMQGSPDLIFYSQLNLQPAFLIPEYPASIESMLLEYISKGDGESAVELVYKLFKMNYEKTLNPEALELLVSMILSSLMKVISKEEMNELLADGGIIDKESHDASRTEDKIERFIMKVSDRRAEEARARKEREKDSLYMDIKHFVDANYSNTEMNIAFIADHFNMQPSALSSAFSLVSDEKLGQYINYVRLEHAKSLLVEGSGLDAVASACGYASLRTFLRVFKQYEGMTPSQYKTLHRAWSKENKEE